MNLSFLISVLVVLTVFCIGALLYILVRPESWSRLVEKENDYWVKRGTISAATAEKIKRLEKGILPKIMLGVTGAIGLAFLVLYVNLGSRHFRAAVPPQGPVPVQRAPQPTPPKTSKAPPHR